MVQMKVYNGQRAIRYDTTYETKSEWNGQSYFKGRVGYLGMVDGHFASERAC